MPAASDTHMRDQAVDKDRRKFTSDLIRAIEELETRRINRTPQQLSDAAWEKLQYDFPVLETAELQALLDIFSASFEGKAAWPCYLLTPKALENISNGARGAASYQPQLTDQEQQVQQLLSESLANKVLARSSSGNSNPSNTQQQQQQEAQVSQQQLYQQLAALLLLRYAAKVASLPDEQAWQLLQAYCPEDTHIAQQQQQPGADIAAALNFSTADTGNAATNGTSSSCVIHEDVEASQQDADSDEYEPMESAHPPQLWARGSSSSGSALQQGQGAVPHLTAHDPRPMSWPDLQHKLLSLAEHVHYSVLAYEPLWRQQHAAQHLLQLLRLLGVHGHAQDLQPLLYAYVGLLVDRLAAAPQDLPLLHQLWEALGLTLSSGLKQTGFRAQQGGPKPQAQQGLHPEAVLGLSVAAAVWQQLPGGAARRQLWQLMYDDLLPLLEVCAEQLAYNSSSKGAGSSSSSGAGSLNGSAAGSAASSTGMAFAHMLLLCHVLELLVLGGPVSVDAAKQLTDLGVTRSLVQLHVRWGSEVAAESLRRAVLLACCSSPHTAAWVLAVPNIRQQLQQEVFQLEGPFEAHGALWQLLTDSSSSSSNSQRSSVARQSTAPAHAQQCALQQQQQQQQQQQLSALLSLPGGGVQQLQRQVVVLQLMVDAQKAMRGRQHVWSDPTSAALRKLAARMKELDSPGQERGAAAAAAAATKDSLSSSDSDSEAGNVQSSSGGSTGPCQQQEARGAEQLEHRRSAQLQPTVLRLAKELLTQGGGKTD